MECERSLGAHLVDLAELKMFEVRLKLRGGLGNQLFQYIAAAFYARKFDSRLLIDDSGIYRHRDKSRTAWLREIDYIETFGFMNVEWISNSGRMYSRFKNRIEANEIVNDENSLKSVQKISRNIVIHDWFINKHYVEEFQQGNPNGALKRSELKLRNSLSVENSILSGKKAALHIRLGDFKNTSWGTLPLDWYLARVRSLEKAGIEELDCYSDELFLLKEIIGEWKLDLNFRFPEEKSPLNPHELLFVLSRYSTFISSNSSLSWWASYFNPDSNAKVLCNWQESLRLENWKYFE